MSAPPPPRPPPPVKWWGCVLLFLARTPHFIKRPGPRPTAPPVQRYLSKNQKEPWLLEGAFNAAFAVGAILVGWAVDRGNIRLIYPAIVILWSLAGFAAGFAEQFWVLLVCRFALGLFEAGNIPCGVLTVKRVLAPAE